MLEREFKLNPSKKFLFFLILGVVASLGIVLSASFGNVAKLLLLLGVFAYGGWLIGRYGLLRGHHAIQCLRWDPAGGWCVQTAAATYRATLRGDSTVTAWLAVLRFTVMPERWVTSCVIFPGSLPRDAYRQLLVTVWYLA